MFVRFGETGRHSVLGAEKGGSADGCIGEWLVNDVADCNIGLSRHSFLYEQLAAQSCRLYLQSQLETRSEGGTGEDEPIQGRGPVF
jgi:hypothetical protein